jgi:dihydrolipoamide dehydrogenase
MKKADVVVIGSGQGGVPLAAQLAKDGRRVVVFERDSWGGSCVNYGCIPSKTFLASAHAAAAARNAKRLGIHAQVEVDFAAVMQRVRDSIKPNGIQKRLQRAGVELIEAEAAFTGPHSVQGGDAEVEAPLIIINTGKAPLLPDVPGLADAPYMTYYDFWEQRELPKRLLIIGGGYIGLELGQGMQRLGSQVELVEKGKRPVSKEEKEVSAALQQALEADGVQFHLDSKLERVTHQGNRFRLHIAKRDRPLEGDALLVVVGQRANVEALQLDKAGIEQTEKGDIVVDDQFCTTAEGVYAIGDVTGQPAFTHVSWEDYRRLYAILHGEERRKGDRVLGYAFFTEPQVGRVGLTEAQAQEKGFQTRQVTLPMEKVSRATMSDETQGFYRLVVDRQTDLILGATLVGSQAAELVHIFLVHMEGKLPWQLLEQSQYIHPTYAENLPTLGRQLKKR